MKRWSPVILGIVLGLAGMAIGGFLSWRKNGREEAAVTFSSVAVCIAVLVGRFNDDGQAYALTLMR
jgi:site-specific recombinase